jgi:hypothetical protein
MIRWAGEWIGRSWIKPSCASIGLDICLVDRDRWSADDDIGVQITATLL